MEGGSFVSDFRKYPYAPHGRSLEIPNCVGERVLKAKNCKEKYNAKLEFLKGWMIQTPCILHEGGGEGMDLLKYFFKKLKTEKRLRKEEITRNTALPFSTQLKNNKNNKLHLAP